MGGSVTPYRVLSALGMVGAVLAVTLPPLAPSGFQVGAAVLAFVLALLGFVRLRAPAGRVSGVVFVGLAFLALAFAVPTAGGLSGGLVGAGAVVLVNAWTAKPGEGKDRQ